MQVLIVGGGRLGAALAGSLEEKGHAAVVVEKDAGRADELRTAHPRTTVVHGDGDEPAVLERAGISHAGAVAAMTDEDEDNLVACLLARREYGVAATYARVNDQRNAWLFGERFGVDQTVAAAGLDVRALAEAIGASGRGT